MEKVSIAVFAHNEEQGIEQSVLSILQSFEGHRGEFDVQVCVLANGCQDRTAEVVGGLERQRREVRLVNLNLGDKCNAWNHYVHELCPVGDFHIFMDGDVTAYLDSGPNLVLKLKECKDALAVTGLPLGGRHSEAYRRLIEEDPTIWGNLYCLRQSLLERMRQHQIRLPIGFIGDDGLLGYLVDTNLDPTEKRVPGRTVVALDALFAYPPLRFLSWHDIKLYWNRRVRYSIRFYQFKFIGPELEKKGIEGLPKDITESYSTMQHFRRPLRLGSNLIFDRIAWARMARDYERKLREASPGG